MSLTQDSRGERKLKAARRAQFRLKQALERIDWETDYFYPEIARWKGQAQLPEPPADMDIAIESDDVHIMPPKAAR